MQALAVPAMFGPNCWVRSGLPNLTKLFMSEMGLSAILCMETNPNQPPLACLLGFSGITSLVIMVWLKATAAGLGLGQLQLFAICCSLWFWFSSFVFLLIYGGFPFAERRQNTPS